MDTTVLAALAPALHERLAGSVVGETGALAPDAVFLVLRSPRRRTALILRPETGLPRFDLPEEFRPPRRPHAAGAAFAARLRATVLRGVHAVPGDRVLEFAFDSRGEFSAPEGITLRMSFLPPRPLLELVDAGGRRLAAAGTGAAARGAGAPAGAARSPWEADRAELAAMLARPPEAGVAEKLRRGLPGLGRALADELAWRAGLAAAVAPPSPADAELADLERALRELAAEVAASGPVARLYLPAAEPAAPGPAGGAARRRARAEIARCELRHLSASHRRAEELPALEAALRCWEELAAGRERERSLAALRTALHATRRRAATLAAALEADLAQAGGAPAARRQGELLLAHLARVPPGAGAVTLPDAFDPAGGEVTVELDPALSPNANAARLFKRARKGESALREIPPRLAAVRAQLAALVPLDAELERLGALGAPAESEIRSLRERVEAATGGARDDRPARPGPGGPARADDPLSRRLRAAGARPRIVRLAPDWIALIGRNSRENDLLTTRVAAPHDLWFHARGTTGSHVIVVRPSRSAQPPPRLVERAAQAAAFFSGARTSAVVPVAWTEARYVRKPRGAAPGAVALLRETVIMVRPARPEQAEAAPQDGVPDTAK